VLVMAVIAFARACAHLPSVRKPGDRLQPAPPWITTTCATTTARATTTAVATTTTTANTTESSI